MSVDEFSVEFDILYNNIQSSQAPGLNLLQKSIALTQAKEDVVKQLYSGGAGPYESSEEVTQYLRMLTKQIDYSVEGEDVQQFNFELPEDLWYIVYEQAAIRLKECNADEYALVKAMSHNEFAKAMDNPFRKPDRRSVIRLLIDKDAQLFCDESVELKGYSMRYLSQPSKIYLKDFTETDAPAEWKWDDQQLNPFYDGSETDKGWSNYKVNACPDIPESLHRAILVKAVAIAKSAWA